MNTGLTLVQRLVCGLCDNQSDALTEVFKLVIKKMIVCCGPSETQGKKETKTIFNVSVPSSPYIDFSSL